MWSGQSGINNKGLLEALISDAPDDSVVSVGFNLVLVFPLPSAVTFDQDEAFRKAHLQDGSSYKSVLEKVLSHSLQETAQLECKDNIESLQNCTIELFLSFFSSLDAGAGCQTYCFTSRDKDQLFLCVRLADGLAEKLAHASEYLLQMDKIALPDLQIKITDTTGLVPAWIKFHPFMKDSEWLRLYQKAGRPEQTVLFRELDRIRLLYHRLTNDINISQLQRMGLIEAHFPGHNRAALDNLIKNWASIEHYWHLGQPIDDVRNYFGEEIAFYFLFTQTVAKATRLLLVPMALCRLLGYVGFADFIQPAFGIVVVFWFAGLTKHWERTEAFHCNRWGTEDEVSVNQSNPFFVDKPVESELDENRLELRADSSKQRRGIAMSCVVSVLYMCLVTCGVAANQMWAAHENRKGNSFASHVAALMLTVQIKIFDVMWSFIGPALTKGEQHVTLRGYNQSQALKTFLMQFINTFYAFYYIAFFEDWVDPDSCRIAGGCGYLLEQNLFIVFATYVAIGLVDMGLPYALMKYGTWQEERAIRQQRKELGPALLEANGVAGEEVPEISLAELQGKMQEYTGDDQCADFLQIIFPLAFVGLFGTVMPVLPVFLSFAATSLQLRADAWKLTRTFKRPFPSRASGIGVWGKILRTLSFLTIFNNIGLILTQIPAVERLLEGYNKLIVFFVLQNIAVCLYVVFDLIVSSESSVTRLEKRRQQLQRSRALETQAEGGHHVEAHVVGNGRAKESSFQNVPGLMKGHEEFSEPVLQ